MLTEPVLSTTSWVDIELRRGKSDQPVVSWGRRVIQAIDCDDHIALGMLMQVETCPNAPVNCLHVTVNMYGYAEYLWTPVVHQFLGDTALHFAIRQRKKRCVYMLLLLGANAMLSNEKGEIAGDMAVAVFQTTVDNMKFDGRRILLELTPPHQLQSLPDIFQARNSEEEAWELMRSGRLMFSELPMALQPVTVVDPLVVSDNTRTRLSFNLLKNRNQFLKNVAEDHLHLNVSESALFGDTRDASHRDDDKAKVEAAAMLLELQQKAKKWNKMTAEDGNFYFVHQVRISLSWMFTYFLNC
jgi:hypothetical protein